MNLEIASLIVFFSIMAILIYKDRKHIEFKYGLVTRRTKRGRRFIYRVAKKYRRELRVLGNIGVIIGIIVSAYTFYSLAKSSYTIFFKPKEATQSLALVFPSVPGVKFPSFVIGVPAWFWIIGVFTVLIAHEPMHGLLARAEKVRIKSLGLLLLFVLPGAFVEPDEKQLKKLSMIKKLRIYAGGSLGNFLLGGFLFLIISYLIYPTFFRGCVAYGYLNYTEFNRSEPFPAQRINLTGPILAIDGQRVEGIESMKEIMSDKKPNQTIIVETTKGIYNLTLTEDPKNKTRGYMGIFVMDYKVLKSEYRKKSFSSSFIMQTTELLAWIVALNIGIGAANLLPIKPLDGGLMFEEITKRFFKKKSKKIVEAVSVLTLGLILIALFGPSIVH